MIKSYPTRSGRQKNALKNVSQSTEYYSLKDAASILKISSNKVAVLVHRGILVKDENNPLSIQIQESSLLNLKNKLNSENYISYVDAAKQLNCPINWIKKYWCDTGFLHIENLVYWKLINKNELTEVLKLKDEFITGAEASTLLGMPHSHITNLQSQGLIKPYYFGKNEKKIRLFNIKDILSLKR